MDLLTRSAAIALVTLAACAHGGDRETERSVGRGEGGRGPAATGAAATTGAEPEPRAISTDRASADDPGAGSPAREASQQVVEEGKGYLIAGRHEAAARRFATATRIDPTNGFAYYYLGRARFEAGDRIGALGVLDKAETLLGPYPEWRARAARLAAVARDP